MFNVCHLNGQEHVHFTQTTMVMYEWLQATSSSSIENIFVV